MKIENRRHADGGPGVHCPRRRLLRAPGSAPAGFRPQPSSPKSPSFLLPAFPCPISGSAGRHQRRLLVIKHLQRRGRASTIGELLLAYVSILVFLLQLHLFIFFYFWGCIDCSWSNGLSTLLFSLSGGWPLDVWKLPPLACALLS